jgi:hypothetical protein
VIIKGNGRLRLPAGGSCSKSAKIYLRARLKKMQMALPVEKTADSGSVGAAGRILGVMADLSGIISFKRNQNTSN